jgi:hypothetical protein
LASDRIFTVSPSPGDFFVSSSLGGFVVRFAIQSKNHFGAWFRKALPKIDPTSPKVRQPTSRCGRDVSAAYAILGCFSSPNISVSWVGVWQPLFSRTEFWLCVLVAATDLPLVLEAVGQLDHELVRLTRQAAVLAGPLAPRDHVATVTNLRRALDRANRAMHSMRERVLDSATELTVDRFEQAFRARTIVLQIQLQTLKIVEPEVAHRMWPSGGRFQSVDDVSVFLLAQIGRLNASWSETRRSIKSKKVEPDFRALIAAVATAERDLIAIGKDHDLISFLAAGASLTCDDFRTACRVIAALLDIALAPLTPITERSIRAPSLARRLASHAPTFSAPAEPGDERDE